MANVHEEEEEALQLDTEVVVADHYPHFCVTGVIADIRPHIDDPSRQLFYVCCLKVDETNAVVDAVEERTQAVLQYGVAQPFTKKLDLFVQTRSKRVVNSSYYLQQLQTRTTASLQMSCLMSPEGYEYTLDGWYDADSLLPTIEKQSNEGGLVDQQGETVRDRRRRVASTSNVPCELQLLGVSIRPWFVAPFSALGYLTPPPTQYAYSVYLCHRCLAPYYDLLTFVDHLQVCRNVVVVPAPRGPVTTISHVGNPFPVLRMGIPIYQRELKHHAVRVRLYDGADFLFLGRHLALLTRCFVESKLTERDVDLYEFYVVSVSRTLGAKMLDGVLDTAQQAELQRYDQTAVDAYEKLIRQGAEQQGSSESAMSLLQQACQPLWNGEIIVGFFCRAKMYTNHALSCIVTIPCFQRWGIAELMLDVAYYYNAVRQRFCGREQTPMSPACAVSKGSVASVACKHCGTDGGGVDRPYSVPGEALLLSYWKKRVIPVLTSPVMVRRLYESLRDVRLRTFRYTHVHMTQEDFELLLTSHDAFFYNHAEQGGDLVGRIILEWKPLSAATAETQKAKELGRFSGDTVQPVVSAAVATRQWIAFDESCCCIPSHYFGSNITAAAKRSLKAQSQVTFLKRITLVEGKTRDGLSDDTERTWAPEQHVALTRFVMAVFHYKE